MNKIQIAILILATITSGCFGYLCFSSLSDRTPVKSLVAVFGFISFCLMSVLNYA